MNPLIESYMALFVGRSDDYALQLSNGSYCRVGRPLTHVQIEEHLQGNATYGTYVMNAAGECRFAVFDADSPDGLAQLWTIQGQLAELGIASYVEASRRGGHLWVFFTRPAPASWVRAWLLPVCPPGLEFYPKQNEGRGYGSLIRLPLGIHRKSGQRYPFVTRGPLGPVPIVESLHHPASWLASLVRVEVPEPARAEVVPSRGDAAPLGQLPGSRVSIRQWNAEQDPIAVIGRYVKLNRDGVGLCPFGEHHTDGHDTQASFKVYAPGVPGGYCWYCYTWHQGGSVFDFLRYYYGLDAKTLWERIQGDSLAA